MLRATSRIGVLALAALLQICPAHADGPAGYRPRERQSSAAPDLAAIDAYNEGYALIQRADHQEALALATSEEQERRDAKLAAADAYRASLGKFALATTLDRSMHEAFTYMGYAHRKLGNHQKSLDAYARALSINPDYPPAIEYQGEAYLGLNQLDSARFNYLRLYALSPGLAGKLLASMQKWLIDHRNDAPAGVDVQAFSAWVEERAKIAPPGASSSSW